MNPNASNCGAPDLVLSRKSDPPNDWIVIRARWPRQFEKELWTRRYFSLCLRNLSLARILRPLRRILEARFSEDSNYERCGSISQARTQRRIACQPPYNGGEPLRNCFIRCPWLEPCRAGHIRAPKSAIADQKAKQGRFWPRSQKSFSS